MGDPLCSLWVSSVNPDKAGCEEGDQHHTTAAPPSPASRAHAGQDLWPSTCRPGSEPHVVDVTAEAGFVVLMLLGGGQCFMKLGVCFKSVGKKKFFLNQWVGASFGSSQCERWLALVEARDAASPVRRQLPNFPGTLGAWGQHHSALEFHAHLSGRPGRTVS